MHKHAHTHKLREMQSGPLIQSMKHTSGPVNKEDEEAGRREGGSSSEGGWWREREELNLFIADQEREKHLKIEGAFF